MSRPDHGLRFHGDSVAGPEQLDSPHRKTALPFPTPGGVAPLRWRGNGDDAEHVMSDQTVLISGAGIAGPTLAYWLARHRFRPTVVEQTVAPRSSGSPVDVRGRAVEVAERMGVMPRIRQAGTDVTGLGFVNAKGRRVGRVNLRALQQAAGSREVELPRGDLASIL
jgi:hypothetical protein